MASVRCSYSVIAEHIVEMLLEAEDYAYRSVTVSDFVAIRRVGIQPKFHPDIRELLGANPRVIWFSDSYSECRGYNDQLTVRFPFPEDAVLVNDAEREFICFAPIPALSVEAEIDQTGEWVPIRKATIRQNMVVKR